MKKERNKIGFDTDKYLQVQTKAIKERVAKFEKLYLEFGGKLCFDSHAARVLPGYRPTAKIELLKKLGDIDIIYCVSAKDIERGKKRGDSGLTYDYQTFKDIKDIGEFGLKVSRVVITRCSGENSVKKFKKKLENYGLKVFIHNEIADYPFNIDKVLAGYEKQDLIDTKKKLTIVTGAGGNSGKMATCLTQVYNERRLGKKTGYAKFETFPIWNLPLKHLVNVAYEASTADLLDVNLIDPFHKKAYGKVAVNYNRDIENFDILINIMKRITGEDNPFGYRSPTDMGVNMAGQGIINDKICANAARQEIIRRFFRYQRDKMEGVETQATTDRMKEIMIEAKIKESERLVVAPARQAAKGAEKKKGKGNKGIFCGAALQLRDGRIVSGKNSPLLHAESAVILNAIKTLAKINDKVNLLPPDVINDINYLKIKVLGEKTESLNVEETIIALSVSVSTNATAKICIEKLKELRGCELHMTHLPSRGDEAGLRKLGINATSDARPNFKI